MRAHRLAFAFTIIAALAAPAFADGSFVKLGDIKGTATEAQHQGWIQIGSWGCEHRDWNLSITKLKYDPSQELFWFEKKSDAASRGLQKAMADRTLFGTVVFDMTVRTETFRTTFFQTRVIAIEKHGDVEKVTMQYKRREDQTFMPPRS
jgi:type VI protein secretion system component Hcp